MKKYINPNVEILEIRWSNALMGSDKPGGTAPEGGDHGWGGAPKRRPF